MIITQYSIIQYQQQFNLIPQFLIQLQHIQVKNKLRNQGN